LNSYGATGALYQMLSHGISTGALFLLVGMIYERTHSREISKYGGLAIALPIYSIVFFIVTLSSIAVPITNGFIGEFFILLGAFAKDKTFAIPATLGVVLGATYMLWMFKKVFFGVEGEIVRQMDKQPHRDLSKRELGLMLPLLIVIFWMGIFPDHFLRWSKSSLDHYVNNFSNYELTITPGAK